MDKIADLAKARFTCPVCGLENKRQQKRKRTCKDIDGVTWKITVGVYFCLLCHKYYRSHDKLFPKYKRYTSRVIDKALFYYASGHTYEKASELMQEKHKVYVPPNDIHDWVTEDESDRLNSKIQRQKNPVISPTKLDDAFSQKKT